MSHLLRSHAPVTAEGWDRIDEEARSRLIAGLAARRLVDFSGPHGWQHSATSLGRVSELDSDLDGVDVRQRRVLPLVELTAAFTMSRDELAAGDRGADDIEFASLDDAANLIADAENRLVFHGLESAGIEGIVPASSNSKIARPSKADGYTDAVAKAIDTLRQRGLDGPYGLALGREEWTRVVESAEHGGYPLLQHLRLLVDGPITWTPGLDGAVVLTLRGGDFLLESGEDLAVGYNGHDADEVSLYIEESLSFRVATPEAAVAVG